MSLLVQIAALKLVWQSSTLKVFKGVEFFDEDRDVVPMIEMECILVITRTTTIIGQCEQYFVGAIGILAKIFCLAMLRHPPVLMLSRAKLEEGTLVREMKPASELTGIGRACKHRRRSPLAELGPSGPIFRNLGPPGPSDLAPGPNGCESDRLF